MAETRIGISGWTYPPWRGVFYPKDLPQKRELEYASRQFNSIELNGSFYSLQKPASYRAWHDATPEGFVFSVKGGKFITHMKRLRDIEIPMSNFWASGVLALKQKFGPMLWQFPPNFAYDEERFASFFALLPHDTAQAAALAKKHDPKMAGRVWVEIDANRPMRHSVEVRHESFKNDQFVKLCRKHKVAIVVADTAGKWPYFDEGTSDFRYVRLHGDEELYVSGYTDEGLDMWATRIRKWQKEGDVYVYFDNDAKVKSPRDAMSLAKRLNVGPNPGPITSPEPARKTRSRRA